MRKTNADRFRLFDDMTLVLIGLITKVNLIGNDVLVSIKSRKLRFRFAKYICC